MQEMKDREKVFGRYKNEKREKGPEAVLDQEPPTTQCSTCSRAVVTIDCDMNVTRVCTVGQKVWVEWAERSGCPGYSRHIGNP